MSATLQSQAIALANRLLTAGQTTYDLQLEVSEILTQWTQINAGAVFAALPTAALNADGSLGIADQSPVGTNPIDTRSTLPGSGLSRAISSNDLAVLNTLMGALRSLLAGTDPGAQASFPQVLNKVVGG